MENSNFIWGFDQGVNSIGWSVIDIENETIIDSGVRIFPAGVENLGQGDKEMSSNAEKTEHRSRMRSKRRKKHRLKSLIKFLQSNDLLPKNITHEFFNQNDPYEIRTKALDKKVELHQIGRAFYHIAKHRGYKSPEDTRTDDSDEKSVIYKGKDKPGIIETREAIEENNYRTLGEFLYNLDPHENRRRDRYTERKMYIDEVDKIWESQKEYHNSLKDDLLNEIKKYLFFQHPLKSQKGRKGKCIFELNRPRAPKSHPVYQRFRMLQQLNNLLIHTEDRLTEESQRLTSEEMDNIIEYLSKNKSIKINKSLKTFRKLLGLSNRDFLDINLKDLKQINGLNTEIKFRNILDEKYDKLNKKDQEKLYHTLLFKKDDDWYVDFAQNEWGFTKEEAEKLAEVKLEPNYGKVSVKAARKLIPYLEEGYKYDEACEKADYSHFDPLGTVELKDELDLPPKIANPVVSVALFELRKICNNLLKIYGRPVAIKFENARELKASKKEREKVNTRRKENEKENEKARKYLQDHNSFKKEYPSRNDIIKYKLWKEVDHICPYTGETISFTDLFVNDNAQVEHILPFSRSRDNSYMNKTVSLRKANRDKGNKTPFEAFSSSPNGYDYDKILERVKTLPRPKASKFALKELEDNTDDWVSSQLNDTRYISKVTKRYLKQICEDVRPVKGGVTGKIRYEWGLNSILNETLKETDPLKEAKNRDDHRHHAIDSIVVALTNYDHLNNLSVTLEREIERRFGEVKIEKERLPKPWNNFRDEVRRSIANIIVSHKKSVRKRGSLFKESNYGWRKFINGEKMVAEDGYKLLSINKNLEGLTKSTIGNIADPAVRRTIIDHIESQGYDVSNINPSEIKKAFKEPVYMPFYKTDKKTQIKSVRIRVRLKNVKKIADYNKYGVPAQNYCLILFKNIDTDQMESKNIQLLEAINTKGNVVESVKNNLNLNEEFVTSIFNKDIFVENEIPSNFNVDDKSTYNHIIDKAYRVTTWADSSRQVFLLRHNSSNPKVGRSSFYPSTFNYTKLEIDPIGYLRYSND